MKSAVAVSLLAVLACAGCAQSTNNAQSRASAAQIEACRRSADQTVQLQNPNIVYQTDQFVSNTRASPFSGPGIGGNMTAGLPQTYSREQYYQNCLNGIGPAPTSFPPAPPGQPAPPPASVTSAPPSPTPGPVNPANLAAPPPSLTSRPPP